jgi:Iron-sulfur cluster-binding domain/4Fe-4S single cluster domain
MNNFYCAAPWRGLHINPRGDIKTCCAGNPNMLGNLNDHNIEEVLQGPKLQEIRRSLRQGVAHEYCSNCVNAEKFGNSEREWHNNINKEFDSTQASDTEHIPTLIDVRWNTTCNLSCNYCDPSASSKWAVLKNIPFKSGTRPYYEQVCDYINQYRPHIREVALVGGEPLLLPENERLLDVIPDDCLVTVITNMSVNLENNRVFKKLAQRKQVGWSMSFDNIGSQFEYVRYGADWSLLQHNLTIIKELFASGHWGGIHAVYNMYNATCLSNLFDWAKSQQLTVHFQTLHAPLCLNPTNHNQSVRNLALTEVKKVLARTDLTDSERNFLLQVKESYDQPASQDSSKELLDFVDQTESTYHSDTKGQFAQLWPELNAILCK